MFIDITLSPVTVKYIVFFAREHCEGESRVYYKTLLLAEFCVATVSLHWTVAWLPCKNEKAMGLLPDT